MGAGRSDPEAFRQHRYLNLHTYASDLLEVCDALALRHVTLVGHSVGGMVCTLATIARPALVEGLVMLGASPRYLNDAGYHGGLSEDDLAAIYRAVMHDYDNWATSFASAAMANPQQPELAARLADSLRTIPRERALTVLCSIFQGDHRDELPRLSVPTLLVQSSEDAIVPLDVAQYMQQHIRHSTLKVMEARGHLPHVSAPEQVVAAMRAFLAAG